MSDVAEQNTDDILEKTFSSEDKRLVEAIVFASAEPVFLSEIEKRVEDHVDVKGALSALKQDYEGRGIELVERQNTWCFRSASDLGDRLALEKQVMRNLSKAAMETLAIIAYHQPVTRPEIESIRGVAVSKGTLDLLMEEGWIALGRKRDVPGRPVTWKTTRAFLDMFGLESIKDLPGLAEMKAAGLLDARASIDIVGGGETEDLFDSDDDNDLEDNKEDIMHDAS